MFNLSVKNLSTCTLEFRFTIFFRLLIYTVFFYSLLLLFFGCISTSLTSPKLCVAHQYLFHLARDGNLLVLACDFFLDMIQFERHSPLNWMNRFILPLFLKINRKKDIFSHTDFSMVIKHTMNLYLRFFSDAFKTTTKKKRYYMSASLEQSENVT